MGNFNDLFYIGRVKAGDIQAFNSIVCQYQQMVLTVVIKIVGNKEEAEDIAQDIFIKVFKSLNQFKKKSEFSTWLYRIAYNTTLSKIRRKKFIFSSFENDFFDPEDESGIENINLIEKEKQIQSLEESLKILPPDENLLITLFYLGDQSIEQISLITNLSIPNVKVKLHQIRKKLAMEMNKRMSL